MSKQAILANYPDAARWAFGDGPELADELLQLVLSGEKTATCSSYASYRREQMPMIGDDSIILDGRGEPACVIKTPALRRCAMTGDRRDGGQRGRRRQKARRFGARASGVLTREGTFAPDMWLVFEEFERVETL